MAKINLQDWTLDGMRNPQQLQAYILDKFEEANGGEAAIVDPNNVATFLIESFATLGSGFMKKIDDTVLPAIYPNRAVSVGDLYRHMSDYDYTGLFSYPAQTSIMMILDVTYLINNGIPVGEGTQNSNRQLIIPRTTQFKIGDYTFGMYYPIKIRVSKETRMFVAEYDTSVRNPLRTLTTNVLEYSIRRSEGLMYAFVKIPVYQFETSTTIEPLVVGSGYKRTIPYKDKFYALKVTAEVRDDLGDWSEQELALSLFGRTYDPEKPTAVFTVDPDNNVCTVEIPYVYFTRNQIRGNLKIEIYTTSGYLNYTIPTDTTDMVVIDMFGQTLDPETARFAEPFRLMPGFEATPIATQITGGSEGYSFEELRKRVINNSYGISVLQTPGDIDTYFANEGYVTSLYKDGITDRVYNAHATLRWTDNSIVSCASLDTLITKETLLNTRSIIHTIGDTYTILPSTRYRFDIDKGICVPLTDTELDELNSLDAANKVAAFNKESYTICPFHIQVNTVSKYPTTAVFDLTDADIDSNVFLKSREEISQQLSVNSALMTVVPVDYVGEEDKVTDRYRMTINVTRTGLDNITAYMQGSEVSSIKQFMVLVAIKKIDGNFAFAEAQWQRREAGIDVFSVDISATAAFTQVGEEHAIRIKAPFVEKNDSGIDVLMSTEIRLILCLRKPLTDSRIIDNVYLETDFTNSNIRDIENFVAVSENQIVAHFGKLVNELDARMSLTYSEEQYESYDSTALRTLDAPIYKSDSNGVPLVKVENDKVILTELLPAGTLTSFSNHLKETIKFSKFFHNNLYGCTAIDSSGNEVPQLFVSSGGTGFPYDNEGDSVVIKDNPVVPRFFISAAQLDSSGLNQCIGDYTVLDVVKRDGSVITPNVGESSGVTNKWLKVDKDSEGVYYYYLEIQDALKFVINNILTKTANGSVRMTDGVVIDGVDTYGTEMNPTGGFDYVINADTTYKADPLSDVVAVDGMFVMVVHDNTFDQVYAGMSEDAKMHLCVLTSAESGVTEGSSPRSVIYFRKSGRWVPLAVCDSSDTKYHPKDDDWSLMDRANHFALGTIDKINALLETAEANVYHGFVYYLHRVTMSGSGDSVRAVDYTPEDQTTHNLKYVAFVTSYGDDIPSMMRISDTDKYNITLDSEPHNGKTYYYRVKHTDPTTGEEVWSYEEATDITDGFVENVPYYEKFSVDPWAAYVDKWPWEVTNWRRFKSYDMSQTVRGIPTYVIDPLFETRFDSARMGIYCKYQLGQIRLNAEGKPLAPKTPRQLQYLVNMLHIDAKLAETTAVKTSRSYPGNLVEVMRNHFNNLGSIKNRLYTNTKLFFEPMRSIGYGKFYTDGETTNEYPLDIRMGFRLHVSSDIAEDAAMIQFMKESVIGIIDNHMAEGGCSMTEIAKLIKEANSDSVRYVDVLGIDGDHKLQTMRCVDPEVRPHLKHELQLEDDGVTITLTRGLDIEFVVADE